MVAAGRSLRSSSSSFSVARSVFGGLPPPLPGASDAPCSAILTYRLTDERLTAATRNGLSVSERGDTVQDAGGEDLPEQGGVSDVGDGARRRAI